MIQITIYINNKVYYIQFNLPTPGKDVEFEAEQEDERDTYEEKYDKENKRLNSGEEDINNKFFARYKSIYDFIENNTEKTFVKVMSSTESVFTKKQKIDAIEFYNTVLIPVLIETERYEWIKHVKFYIAAAEKLKKRIN